jgi:hypothetical protein
MSFLTLRYQIWVLAFREVSIGRATPGEAIHKAKEMMAAGITEIRITDTTTYRTYEPNEFHLILSERKPRRKLSAIDQTPTVP